MSAPLRRAARASLSVLRSGGKPAPCPQSRIRGPIPHRGFWSSAPPPLESTLDLASTFIPQISADLLPLLLAILLASSDSDPDSNNLHSPPWRVTDFSSAGKGLGAVASRDLARGELLIAERPLCVWPQGLSGVQAQELFSQMGEREQKVFMQLAVTEGEGSKGMGEILARRATNGFAVQLPLGGEGPRTVSMVFPKTARLNHSCLPNASQAMNFQTLRMEVYTLTPIPQGTELNIEYIPQLVTQTRLERQASLRSSFGFTSCLCAACTASPDEIEKSDQRRSEIKLLSEGMRVGRGDRRGTMEKMGRMRVLLEEEGYLGLPEFEDTSISNAYAVYASMYARSQKAGE